MKRLVITTIISILLVIVASDKAIAQSASIAGRITDDGGLALRAHVTAFSARASFHSVTDSNGNFMFRQLSTGSYTICGFTKGEGWNDPLVKGKSKFNPLIDSCASLDVSPVKVIIRGGDAHTAVKLLLQHGRQITVRVNDPSKLLPEAVGKHSGPEMGVWIAGPSGAVRRIPILSQDKNGRTHAVILPYDIPHRVSIESSQFALKDDKGDLRKDSATNVTVSRGGPEIQLLVTVFTKGAK